MQYRHTLVRFLLFFVLAAPALRADESNFVRIKPFNGMSLEVPKTWKAVDDQTKAEAATVIEALFDSRGVKAVAPKASGIFSAQPPSQDPGVGVTIVAEPGSMSQEKVSSLTDEQLRALGKGDQDIIKQTIEPLQLRLVSFSQIRRQVVGGKTA